MSTISSIAFGVSPAFPITVTEFKLWLVQAVTQVSLDGVVPPSLDLEGGVSAAHDLRNRWFPWIDEKLVPPKYDGVCQYLGIPSNRPTQIKDYHMIALMRAVDYMLAPTYRGLIVATVDTVRSESAGVA